MRSRRIASSVALVMVISLMSFLGCSKDTSAPSRINKASQLAGTWKLESRIIEDHVVPAQNRQLRLQFNKDSTFEAFYRPTSQQQWVKAGSGALLYDPPNLVMFWDDGRETQLVVLEHDNKKLKIHHGRNLAPLEDQRPQELFLAVSGGAQGSS